MRFRGYPSKGARAAFSPPQRRITITECDLAHRLSPDCGLSPLAREASPFVGQRGLTVLPPHVLENDPSELHRPGNGRR